MNRGLLLTVTEPPPGMEEEFNAWYDEEHLPERLAIPGFRSARRWVGDGPPGAGRYLATYELDCAAVLDSPAYLARLNAPTPWSRRCLGKCVVFRRWACEQRSPGDAGPRAGARALLLDLRGADAAPPAGALQSRRFYDAKGNPAWVALHELGDEPRPTPRGLSRYRAY